MTQSFQASGKALEGFYSSVVLSLSRNITERSYVRMYNHLGYVSNIQQMCCREPLYAAVPDNSCTIVTWLRIALLHLGVFRIDQLAIERKPSAL